MTGLIMDRTNGVDAAFDAAEVALAVQSALECLGERRTLVSVAIYDKPIPTPLIQLLLRERRIQGTIYYNSDDYRAVIDLMARRHYDTTGWVETIPWCRAAGIVAPPQRKRIGGWATVPHRAPGPLTQRPTHDG